MSGLPVCLNVLWMALPGSVFQSANRNAVWPSVRFAIVARDRFTGRVPVS